LVARLAQLGLVELCVREVPSGSFEDISELVRLILWVVRLYGEEATRENLPVIPVVKASMGLDSMACTKR